MNTYLVFIVCSYVDLSPYLWQTECLVFVTVVVMVQWNAH